MLSTIVAAAALIASVISVVIALVALSITKKKSVRSISLRRMTLLEAEMTEITDSLAAVRAAMHKIRSRQNMAALRSERGTAQTTGYENGEPTDPDAWYKWARAKHLTNKGI